MLITMSALIPSDAPPEAPVSPDLAENLAYLRREMGVGVSFDVLLREFEVGGRRAALFFLDGFVKDIIITNIMNHLFTVGPEEMEGIDGIDALVRRHLGYLEISVVDKLNNVMDQVLAGPVALFLDGEARAAIIDARTYPSRDPDEPDLERVTRGPRDGFTETVVVNTALVRRRVRDSRLRVEMLQVGKRSKTDVALLYIKDIANKALVDAIRKRVEAIEVDSLHMSDKSLEEFITTASHYNPFPIARFTERPDVAAIHLLEGHALLLVDTSPTAIIAPATLFHHVQHAEEYRENPFNGFILRWTRFAALVTAMFITPAWLAVAKFGPSLPEAWRFLLPTTGKHLSAGLQLVLGEIGLEFIRMAAIHTPQALATALGIVAAVMIGEMAVKVGLLSTQALLYVAIAAVATFAVPSFELRTTVRNFRFLLLFVVWAVGWPGLVAGVVAIFTIAVTTRSFGVPYLWPVLPWDWSALKAIIIRLPVPMKKLRPSILTPRDPDHRPTSGN